MELISFYGGYGTYECITEIHENSPNDNYISVEAVICIIVIGKGGVLVKVNSNGVDKGREYIYFFCIGYIHILGIFIYMEDVAPMNVLLRFKKIPLGNDNSLGD